MRRTKIIGNDFNFSPCLVQVSRQGLSRIGKQTVAVEYKKEIKVKGRKIEINIMAYYQFYLNYSGLSKYF